MLALYQAPHTGVPKNEKQGGLLGPLEDPWAHPTTSVLAGTNSTKLLSANKEAQAVQRDLWVALSHPGQPVVCRRQGEQLGPVGPLGRGAGTAAIVPKPLVADGATSSPSCPLLPGSGGTRYRWTLQTS